MQPFLPATLIVLLLPLVSTIDSDSQNWKNRPKNAQSDANPYTDLIVDPNSMFDTYVPSLNFDFIGFGIGKRAEHKSVHGYSCGGSKHQRTFYEQNHINDAATKACAALGVSSGKKRKFLIPYEAKSYTRFQGPYYEYPIQGKHKKKFFGKKRKNKYPNRVIINTQCEIADVVTKDADFHYQQCTRGWH